MDYQIGEVARVYQNGEIINVKCVPDIKDGHICGKRCALFDGGCSQIECRADRRDDGKEVIFVLVETA